MVFQGKNVVVTGGANGIGLAICGNIVAAGGSVWIFDMESENPAEAAQRVADAGAQVKNLPDAIFLQLHAARLRLRTGLRRNLGELRAQLARQHTRRVVC